MPHTLQALADFTAARLIGDGNIEINKVASIAQLNPATLVFVQDEKHLAAGSGFARQRRHRRRVRELIVDHANLC